MLYKNYVKNYSEENITVIMLRLTFYGKWDCLKTCLVEFPMIMI